jgi:hypothetical protein
MFQGLFSDIARSPGEIFGLATPTKLFAINQQSIA